MTDNGGELRARAFRDTIREPGAEHRFIRSRRPQTNGCVDTDRAHPGRWTRGRTPAQVIEASKLYSGR